MPRIADKPEEKAAEETKEETSAKPSGKIKGGDLPEELGNDYYTYAEAGTVQAKFVPDEDVYIVVTGQNEEGQYEGEYVDAEEFSAKYVPVSPNKTI